jgi:hypothetical protein
MITGVLKDITELAEQKSDSLATGPAEPIEIQCTGKTILEVWVVLLQAMPEDILNVC